MTSPQEQVKPDYRLLRALASLNQLGCHVTIQDDWMRDHCFTVDFEFFGRLGQAKVEPFPYVDVDGKTKFSSSTHTHTGFPDCTEEQGYKQLCEALERTAEVIRKYVSA